MTRMLTLHVCPLSFSFGASLTCILADDMITLASMSLATAVMYILASTIQLFGLLSAIWVCIG
jgi:hypothetical protein